MKFIAKIFLFLVAVAPAAIGFDHADAIRGSITDQDTDSDLYIDDESDVEVPFLDFNHNLRGELRRLYGVFYGGMMGGMMGGGMMGGKGGGGMMGGKGGSKGYYYAPMGKGGKGGSKGYYYYGSKGMGGKGGSSKGKGGKGGSSKGKGGKGGRYYYYGG